MKKIAIITELSLNSTNYGNNIQAYALNKYLRTYYKDYLVETILLKKRTGREVTSFFFYAKRILVKFQLILKKRKKEIVDVKRNRFNGFVKKYINVSHANYTYKELKTSDYDYYIVGSDIVWIQSKGFINKAKFIAFNPNKKDAKKIAYAASFGENRIPSDNRKKVINYLKGFNAISVREKDSVGFLNRNGIDDVSHVCDPTLLLSSEDWNEITKDVKRIDKYIGKKYALIYILGFDKHEKEIKEICKKMDIVPVFVSCEKLNLNNSLEVDYFDDCSPQEWIWMIKHAEFVITDSFHGLIFSTIFKKHFLVIERSNTRNLNIRLTDYLEKIGETDKLVDITRVNNVERYIWDYSKIKNNMDKFIDDSKKYITSSIT